jgi:hypothetical protein
MRTVVQIDPSDLDEVRQEDRSLVADVISVLSVLPNRLVKSWVVSPRGSNYEVQAFIDTKSGEWEVTHEDLDLLHRIDDFRVRPVTVRVGKQSALISVGVISRSERVMQTEHDVVRIKRRRTFMT